MASVQTKIGQKVVLMTPEPFAANLNRFDVGIIKSISIRENFPTRYWCDFGDAVEHGLVADDIYIINQHRNVNYRLPVMLKYCNGEQHKVLYDLQCAVRFCSNPQFIGVIVNELFKD